MRRVWDKHEQAVHCGVPTVCTMPMKETMDDQDSPMAVDAAYTGTKDMGDAD